MRSPSSADIDDKPMTFPVLPARPARPALLDAHDAVLASEAAMLAAHLDDAQMLAPDLQADAAVSVFLTAKRLAEAAAAPYARLQGRAKAILAALIEDTGQLRFVVHAGEAYLPRPSVRVTYDARELDRLCASDEAIAAMLRPYRRETVVAPALTIREGDR